MNFDGMTVSIIIFGIGIIFIALGLASYSIRSFLEKEIWKGLTKPLLFSGLIITILGIIMIYINYLN